MVVRDFDYDANTANLDMVGTELGKMTSDVVSTVQFEQCITLIKAGKKRIR